MLHTYQEYLEILDGEVSRRNDLSKEELMEFLKLSQVSSNFFNHFQREQFVSFDLVIFTHLQTIDLRYCE